MKLSAAERQALIEQCASAPARLRQALARVPPEALQWKPSPDEFSVHEVIVHCADSETNDHMRIRYLVGEKEPTIIGYNESAWARVFDYHNHPLDVALATVEAVRANTAALLRRLPEEAWQSQGTHTELGRHIAENWLTIYSDHLEEHIAQINSVLEAWYKR
ncbi:MAG: DinB family protein [Chloroflexi bacterium]|nr:DinB family protein [Chloroflexota bacterium]